MPKTSTDNFPVLRPTLSPPLLGQQSLLCWNRHASHAFFGPNIVILMIPQGARSLSRCCLMDIKTLSRIADPFILSRLRITASRRLTKRKKVYVVGLTPFSNIIFSFKFSLTILSLLSLASSAAVFCSVFFVGSGLPFRFAPFPGTSYF